MTTNMFANPGKHFSRNCSLQKKYSRIYGGINVNTDYNEVTEEILLPILARALFLGCTVPDNLLCGHD